MEPGSTAPPAPTLLATDLRVANAVRRLESVVAAVNHPGASASPFERALNVLRTLARQKAIPIAIVGGMAAIRHGNERLTNDLDVVIGHHHLDTIIGVAPRYGIKVVWHDPAGWHQFQFEGVKIEVVPEGGQPRPDAPTTIPGPRQLGVTEGVAYASLEGWIETKLGAGRRQDQADVVQVIKRTDPTEVARVRIHVANVHALYLRLFDELVTAAADEQRQEAARGSSR